MALNIVRFGVKFRMSKRKKDKKSKEKVQADKKSEDKCEKFSEKENSKIVLEEKQETLPKEFDEEASETAEKSEFEKRLEEYLEDLYYISETDAEFSVFSGEKAKSVSKEEILRQTKKPLDAKISEKDFAEFFGRLTKIQDWFEEEETENARRFEELEKLLKENLTNLKVFKIGEIQLEIYIVGLDSEGVLRGVKTEAVET